MNTKPKRRKQTDEDEAIEKVQENAYILKFLNDSLQDNKTVVMAALKKKTDVFKYASISLQKDPDVVIQACCDPLDNYHFNLVQLWEMLKTLRQNGGTYALKGALSKKDPEFFDRTIDLLDSGDYFQDITMDLSTPYVTDKEDGFQHLEEERQYLDFILDILPEDLLNKKTNSKGIQKIFQEEVLRRNLLSIEQNDKKQKTRNISKRKVL